MIHCVALLAVLALGAADSQGKCVKGTPECDAQEGLDSQSLLQFKVNLTESDEAESEAGAVSGGTGSKKACRKCVKGSWKEVKKEVKADCKKKHSKGWRERKCVREARKKMKKAFKTTKCADECDFSLLQESALKQQFSAMAEEKGEEAEEEEEEQEEEEEDMDDEDDEADLEEDKAADQDSGKTCPKGTRGPGGTCKCSEAPGFGEGWKGPWCYEGKCYAGVDGDPRCAGKPANKYGGSLGDGTWCFGERRDTECPAVPAGGPPTKSPKIECESGERGDGGVCSCDGSPGYDPSWQGPWCYAGKAYAGLPGYPKCAGKPEQKYGGSLGDGTWCFGTRRDTECACKAAPPVSGGGDDDDDDDDDDEDDEDEEEDPCEEFCSPVPHELLQAACKELFKKSCDAHWDKLKTKFGEKPKKLIRKMKRAMRKIGRQIKKWKPRLKKTVNKCVKCQIGQLG